MSDSTANSPPREPDDPEGVAAAEGFLRTFNGMRSELVNTLFHVLGNYEDAMDAAQDAFLKCWRTQDSLVDIKNMRAWIFKIGMNAAKDLQRNAWRRRVMPMGQAPVPELITTGSPADQLEDRETQERLRHAILDLRVEEREVFLLRQNGNLTYDEIAEIRACPVGTIKTQMRTALQKLRSVLQES